MHIGIIFPVLKNWNGLAQAINSIRTKHKYDLFIVDNQLRKLSLAAAWNLGTYSLITREAEIIFICNDDIIFSPVTIDAIVDRLMKEDSPALVSATNKRGQMEPKEILNFIPNPNEISEAPHPDFSCFAIPKSTFVEVGEFDANFNPAFFEDNDYAARIVLSDKVGLATTAAPYYHFGSVTQNYDGTDNPVVPGPAFNKCRDYFKEKWGSTPVNEPEEMKKIYYKHPFNDPRFSLRDWLRP